MESKSERQHDHAKETEDIQSAQESAQASSETQASSGQSEEQSLPSDRLKNQIQPRRQKKVLSWAVWDVSHLIDDFLIYFSSQRNERRGWHPHNKLLQVVQLGTKKKIQKKFS